MGLLGNSALAVFIFLVISLAFLIVTVICRGLYRVYLSRLTGIPGPWLAKATGLYEFYQDLFGSGRYLQMIELLHDRLGKVIRISPHTISIADASVYHQHLLGGRDFKWPTYPDEDIVIRPFELQRIPENLVKNSYLLLRRLNPLEPLFLQKYAGFLSVLDAAQANDMPIKMHMAFFHLSAAIIKACYLRQDTPHADEHDPEDQTYGIERYESPIATQYPWYISAIKSFFRRIEKKINLVKTTCGSKVPSDEKVLMSLFDNVKNPAVIIPGFTEHADEYILNDVTHAARRPPAYQWMSDKKIALDMSVRLSRALTVLFKQLFHDSARLAILRYELSHVIQDHTPRPILNELLKLPYLNSCVREALRLSDAMDNCIVRHTHNTSWKYDDGQITWKIPEGTHMRINAKIAFHEPRLFPDSRSFRPERFMETPELKELFDQFTPEMEVTFATMLLTTAFLFRSYSTMHLEPVSCVGWFEPYYPRFYNMPDRELFGYGGLPLISYVETNLQHVIRPRRFNDQEERRESLDITDLHPEMLIFGDGR